MSDYELSEKDFAEVIDEEESFKDDPETDPNDGNGDGGNGDEDQNVEDEPDQDDPEDDGEADDDDGDDESDGEETGDFDIEEDQRLVVDGEPVLYKDLVKAYKNQQEWAKSNTQKAQKLAQDRKDLDAKVAEAAKYKGVIELFRSDSNLLSQVKSYLGDNKNAVEALDAALSVDPGTISSPYDQQIKDLQKQVALFNAKEKFQQNRNDLVKRHNLSPNDAKGVEKIMVEYFKENKITLSHEQAYKFWKADQITRSGSKKPTPPEKPRPRQKTGSSRSGQKPKRKSGRGYGLTASDFKSAVK